MALPARDHGSETVAVERPFVEIAGTGKKVRIGETRAPVLVGERINPTNRKTLQAKIKQGDWAYIQQEAVRQAEAGAQALDVNVGVPGIDERAAMVSAVRAVQDVVDIPIVIDNSNPDVLREALAAVQGRPLVNSTSGESKKLESVIPVVHDHGAAVIGLTLEDAGIPQTAERRVEIAALILKECERVGLGRKDLVIDCLVLTAGASDSGAMATLGSVKRVTDELGLNTICGLSNVSFGLPERAKLNATMLSLLTGLGLSSFIGNPLDPDIQYAVRALRLLWGEDRFGTGYLTHFRKTKEEPKTS